MSSESERRRKDIELIRILSRSLSGVESQDVQDEVFLRHVYFSDADELGAFAKSLADSPVLTQRFILLSEESDRLSDQPFEKIDAQINEQVVAFVSSAIEESASIASSVKLLSDAQWQSPLSSQIETENLRRSGIRLIAHSVRASLASQMYVSSFRGAALQENSTEVRAFDSYAEIDSEGRLHFHAMIEVGSGHPVSYGDMLGLYLIDPCGGSLLLGEARLAEESWSIEVEDFRKDIGLEETVLPSRFFAVGVKDFEPNTESWRAYLYSREGERNEASAPVAELLLTSQPKVEDGILTFEVELPDGMSQMYAEKTLRLHMRIGWRHQSLAEWPISALIGHRYLFEVPFPYVENQAVPFGSMFYFEIC